MALLFAENFVGTSGVPASFTQATSGGTFALSANQGVMTPPAGSYVPTNWACTGGPTVADSDTYVDMTFADLGETYPSLVARSPAGNTGYTPNGICYQILPSATNSQLFINGVNVAYGPPPSAPGVWRARLRVVGNSVRTKLWLKSNPEPIAWDIDVTQTTVTAAGQTMLALINGATSRPMTFDNLAIYDAAGVPIVLPVGAPAGVELAPFSLVKSNAATVPTGSVDSNGRTFTPIKTQTFAVDAALGQVRSVYSDMGYFTAGQGDTGSASGNAGGSTRGIYDADSVLSVHDGMLDFWLHTGVPSANAQANGIPATPRPLVACVMPDNYTPITYGRVAVRYKVEATVGVGYKFVPMFWPVDDDWNKGEIDFVEFDIKPGSRTRPANATPGTLGQAGNGGPIFRPDGDMYAPDDVFDWHWAVCEWTPDGIFIYHDGILQAVIEAWRVPMTPMRVELQGETFIAQGVPATNAEAHIFVDSVITYSMDAASITPTEIAKNRIVAMAANRTAKKQPVVWLGSSSVAGTAATANAKRFVNLLGTLLQADYPSGLGSETVVTGLTTGSGAPFTQAGFHHYNGGVGGATAGSFLPDATVAQVAAVAARLAVIMIGANDERGNVAPATYQANLLARVNALKAANPDIIVLLVNSYQPYDGTWTYPHSAYAAAMVAVQQANPRWTSYITVDPAFVAVGISPNNGLNDTQAFMDADHIHMNDRGHAFMAETIRGILQLPGTIVVPPGGATDTTAPTAPGKPTVEPVTGGIKLTWTQGTDAVGITQNRVYRNGTAIQTIAAGTTYTDTAAVTGTVYSYTVTALDLAGNESSQSPAGWGMAGTRFDTANRADGAVGTADSGQTYNTRLSTALPAVISSNQFKQAQPYVQDTGVTSRRMSSIDVGTGTAAMAFGFHVGATPVAADASGGFAFNVLSTGVQFMYLSFRQSGTSLGLSLVKITSAGGAPSVIQAGTTVLATGDFVSVTFVGTTVTVSVNGTQVFSVTTNVLTKATSEVGPYFSGAFNGGIDDWVAA